MTEPPMYDTIVVGLGAAGASAASTLARAGRRVLALEAQDRVGGRVWTQQVEGGVVELGAEWIHGVTSSSVFNLATANKVPLKIQELTFEVYRSDGSPTDRALMAELIDYCLGVMEEGSEEEISLGDLIEKEFRAYLARSHPALQQDTDFLSNFLELMNLLVVNHEAADDWRLVTARSQYTPLEGEQHVSWHEHGYSTLFEILLNTYNNGPGLPTLDIKLNKEVSSIQWSASGVVVTCADGEQYSADNVIVTVSLGVLKERHASLFSPGLPAEKRAAVDSLTIGVMNKVVLTFDRQWWSKQASFFGFLWRDCDKRELRKEDYWVTKIFGASTPMGARNTLTLWTSGEVGRMVETMPEHYVRDKLVELLQRFVGRSGAVPAPTRLIRSRWYSNRFTRGSYSYDSVGGGGEAARRALAAPLPAGGGGRGAVRVLFAGEATHCTLFSTVHGAVDSGRREAKRLLPASKM